MTTCSRALGYGENELWRSAIECTVPARVPGLCTTPSVVRGNERSEPWNSADRYRSGEGSAQHRPAEVFCSTSERLSTMELPVERGLDDVRVPRSGGPGTRTPSASAVGRIGSGSGKTATGAADRQLYDTGVAERRVCAGRWCRAGRGARAPATKCSYAVRHTVQGACFWRRSEEHSRQFPCSSDSCAVSSVRHPSVNRGISERATARRAGASARFASSVNTSSRSHTALRSL